MREGERPRNGEPSSSKIRVIEQIKGGLNGKHCYLSPISSILVYDMVQSWLRWSVREFPTGPVPSVTVVDRWIPRPV